MLHSFGDHRILTATMLQSLRLPLYIICTLMFAYIAIFRYKSIIVSFLVLLGINSLYAMRKVERRGTVYKQQP